MNYPMLKNNNIKVSVTMPAYNASRFIRETIESVLAQDYNKFELLIIDDGSTDDTWEVIKIYRNHPKIRIYRNNKNLGVGATRNRLLRLAKGQYISPCDADDIMLPGNLKTLSRFLDTHPDTGAVYGDFLVLERDNKDRILKPPYIKGGNYNKGWDLMRDLGNYGGSMIRKSLILKVGGYDKTIYSGEDDWDLWLKLAEVTKFKYLKDRVYYIYRRHPKSLTQMARGWHSDALRIRINAIKRRYGFDFKI